jgi:hypothetical protein
MFAAVLGVSSLAIVALGLYTLASVAGVRFG